MRSESGLNELAKLLTKLSTVSQKQSKRLALEIANMKYEDFSSFIKRISTIKSRLKTCPFCNALIANDPCEYCHVSIRSHESILIIQDMIDLELFQNISDYNGRFFLLNKLISPLSGVFASDLPLEQLKNIVFQSQQPKEIIFGLDQNLDAEATILFLSKFLRDEKFTGDMYRLARGLPVGAEVEFSAQDALMEALKLKQKIT